MGGKSLAYVIINTGFFKMNRTKKPNIRIVSSDESSEPEAPEAIDHM